MAEIWDALKAAAEATDMSLAQTIVESAGIIVQTPDLTTCYDERGEEFIVSKMIFRQKLHADAYSC